jgi:hypothetical protein
LFRIKLELLKRTDTALDVGFCHINRMIRAYVDDSEISIPITWEDDNWDVIKWFESRPRRVPNGYVCDLCVPGKQTISPSREALWLDHVFEPLRDWVNNALASADAVAVSGDPDGGTWAKLVPARQEAPPAPV